MRSAIRLARGQDVLAHLLVTDRQTPPTPDEQALLQLLSDLLAPTVSRLLCSAKGLELLFLAVAALHRRLALDLGLDHRLIVGDEADLGLDLERQRGQELL